MTFKTIIRKVFREASLYRMGGDEFIVICEGLEEKEFAEKVQQLKALCQSQIDYTFSVGADWAATCHDIEHDYG